MSSTSVATLEPWEESGYNHRQTTSTTTMTNQPLSQKISIYGVSVLLFVMLCPQAFQPYILGGYTFYDYHRIIQIVLFVWVAFTLLMSKTQRESWIACICSFSYPVKVLISAFFILGIVSSLFAKEPSLGFLWVAHTFLWFVFGVWVRSRIKSGMTYKVLAALMLFIGLYMSFEWMNFISIWVHQLAHHAIGTNQAIQSLRFPAFSNPRFLGQVLAFTIPLVVIPAILAWQKNHKGLSVLLMILAIGWWQMLWMNQSRALYLEIAILGIFILMVLRQSALKYIATQTFAALAGLGVYLVMFHLLYHIPVRSAHSFHSDTRLHLWLATLHLIIKHPLLGVGPLNFYPFGKVFHVSHPHNAILFIAVEWGIPAATCVIFITLKGLISWLKFAFHKPSLINIGLTGALVAGIIDAQFSGVVLMPVSQVVMAILIGWLLSFPRRPESRSRIKSGMTSCKSGITIILLITTVVTILSVTIPQILILPQRENQLCALQYQHSNRCLLMPQYFGDLAK